MKSLTKILLLASLLPLIAGNTMVAAKAKQPQVKSIMFKGNISFPDSRLEGLMLTRPSRFLATNRYYPDIFHDDLDNIISFYRQNGFLQAQITDTTIVIDSLGKQVDIAIELDEGERTFIEGLTLFDNRLFTDSVLLTYVTIKKGDPLRRPVIEDVVVALLSLYAEHGILDASITPKVHVNDSAHLALVDIVIREGPVNRVGDIEIKGADRTRPSVIIRELTFSPRDTIKYSELIKSQRQLYLTGLFESVFVRPAPLTSEFSGIRKILIEVKEKPSSELAFSVGYGTVDKIRGRIELTTSNLAGTARKAGIGLEANFIKQRISMSFSEPWTFDTRWRSDISIYGQLCQEPAFHAETVGGKFTIGRNIRMNTTLSISYRMENTNLTNINLDDPLEEPDPRIRSFMLSINHDSRDNLFNPSTGWYIDWSNEIAGSFLHGSNTFARSVISVKSFKSLGRHTVIGSALELGWMTTFGGDDEIPVNERFYTGGPISLRGFRYQMVGPIDLNGEPLGGQLKLVWNLVELRQSLFRMFGGVLFVDIGNIWLKPKTVQLSQLRINLGTGFRYNSPLGILRLDYGINLDRKPDEPGSRLFFSMGQAF